MNRIQYCVLFFLIALAAVLFGIFYYFYHSPRVPRVMDGTLVERTLERDAVV